MAILTGEIVPLNRLENVQHAVGADVVVRHDGKTIGTGVVDRDDEFTVEIPDDVRGEIEVLLGMNNAAPTLVTFEGEDLNVMVFYNNVNNFIG